MSRPPSAESIIRNTKREIYEPVTPIGTELIIPNYSGVKTANGQIKDNNGILIPVGTIIMYGAAAAPTGWLLCNHSSLLRAGTYADLFAVIGTTFGSADGTHFNVPDMSGIFPVGAGNGNLGGGGGMVKANGGAYARGLGTYYTDRMQGHKHNLGITAPAAGPAAGVWTASTGTTQEVTTSPITDGTNGTPRTGDETSPAALGLSFIIKY